MKTYTFVVIPLLLFCSCGPSVTEAEKALQHSDSLKQFEILYNATIDSIQQSLRSQSMMDSVRSTDSAGIDIKNNDMNSKVTWVFKGMNNFKVTSLTLEGKNIGADKLVSGEDNLQLDFDLDVDATLSAKPGSIWFMAGSINGQLFNFNGNKIVIDTIPESGKQQLNAKIKW